jgi:hypothetical protein
MLTEIYGWFIEGFDTADLKDAKALLVCCREVLRKMKCPSRGSENCLTESAAG